MAWTVQKKNLTLLDRTRDRKSRPKAAFFGGQPRFFGAGHLAFYALDVEAQATQKLVIGHGVFGDLHLAGDIGDRASPDVEGNRVRKSLARLSSWPLRATLRPPVRRPFSSPCALSNPRI